jgi:hypothetical protein
VKGNPTWSAFINGQCVVCDVLLNYNVKVPDGGRGIPEVAPSGDYVAYRDGHMCRRCADLVAAMVHAAREQLKRSV